MKFISALIMIGLLVAGCASTQQTQQGNSSNELSNQATSQNAQSQNGNFAAQQNAANSANASNSAVTNYQGSNNIADQGAAINNSTEFTSNTVNESESLLPDPIANVAPIPVNTSVESSNLQLTNNTQNQSAAPENQVQEVPVEAPASNVAAAATPNTTDPSGILSTEGGKQTAGQVSWVGYNYQREAKKLDVQIVTSGQPAYKIFREVNRLRQPEIVVRFLNTDIRSKIKRDIDASEFLSPVAYIRIRKDAARKTADVILTMRDDLQPQFVAKGSHIMLSFDIPEKWYGPQTAVSQPVAKLEITPDEGAIPVSSDADHAPYVDDPGRDTFKNVPAGTSESLVPVPGSSELVPANSLPKYPSSGFIDFKSKHSKTVNEDLLETRFTILGVAQANAFTDLAPQQTAVSGVEVVGMETTSNQNPDAQLAAPKKAMKFDFRNATIGSVLRAIASESGLNFVMPPEVSNMKVTVSLSNVAWDVALKAVLETSRLGMDEISPGIIRIDVLKTFVDDRDAQARAKQANAALVPTKVLVMKLSYANAEDAAKLVQTMIPKAADASDIAQKRNFDRFRVSFDKRSNAVIVEATPNEISKIKSLIERIDMQTPQVKIASRIVEVISKVEEAFGINWGSPFNADGGRGTGFGSLPFPNSLTSTFAVDPGFAATPAGAVQMKLGSINNALALDINIKAMEGRNEAESLQNQDMLVEDNETAEIVAGSTDYFQIPAQGNAPGAMSQVDYNTSLKVRPHITADGSVQMKIEITGDSPVPKLTANAEAGKITRKLSTTLLRKSGDTAVIGGLYSTDKSRAQNAVPFLSKIPILGALFRSTSKMEQKRDLLIMITPTIQSGVMSGSDTSTTGMPPTSEVYNSTVSSNVPTNMGASTGNIEVNSEFNSSLNNAATQQNSSQNSAQEQSSNVEQENAVDVSNQSEIE